MEKKNLLINDLNIKYIEEGQGSDIVVVLHGWGANIESVTPIINSLKNKYKVYAYDAPGFGDSQEPKDVFGTEDYMNILLGFLEKLDIKKAHFIGHSFGGKTLTLLASRYPDFVNKLVLVDASGVIAKRKLKYYFKVYSFKLLKIIYVNLFARGSGEERLKEFYKKYGSDDYRSSQGIMRNILVKVVNESTRESFKDIKAETLLIWGEDDEDTPLYMAEIFEKEIPNSGLVVLKNAGHYSYIDDYNTFNAVINSFL